MEKRLLPSNKKKIIRNTVIGVCAAAAVMGITFWKDVYPGKLLDRFLRPASQEMEAGPVTAMVERQDVEQLFKTTGSIISSETESVNARAVEGGSASGYIVDEVMVKIGDVVREGDVLYTVDMSVAEADLALQNKKLALAEQSNAIDSSAEARRLRAAQEASAQQNATDTRHLQQSADDLNWALVEDTEAAAAVKIYIDKEEAAKAAYESAKAAFDAVDSEYQARQAAATDAKYRLDLSQAGQTSSGGTGAGGTSGSAGTASSAEQVANDKAQAELARAAADRQLAEKAMSDAKSVYDTASSTRQTAEGTLSSNDKAITAQYRALLDQGDAVITSSRTQYEAEQSQKDAVAKQQIAQQASALETEDAIRKAEEKLKLNTVTAPIGGTVTAVNVAPGQAYSGTNAVEIQNTATMKATADIDEAQIADIAVGTEVRVTTDATGAETITGTVCFVSPIPTTDASASTSSTATTSSAASAKRNARRTAWTWNWGLSESGSASA